MAADLPPTMTLDEAQRFFDRPAFSRSAGNDGLRNEAQKARAQAIMDTALSVGVKAGLSWQLRNIEAAVTKSGRDLDLIYDFTPLMIKQRVVPAVITEARDLYNQDGDYAVRLSGAFYTIKQQARFASVAPNWREYLTFPRTTVDRSGLLGMMMPKDADEHNAWKVTVKSGWEQGVAQANIMLSTAMDRLNRDFVGMTRFHRFAIEGKVSLPAIATEDIAVTKEGATMAVDETLLRLTTLPDFNSKINTWQGVVTSQPRRVTVLPAAAPVIPQGGAPK